MKKYIDNVKTWYFGERLSLFDVTIITILSAIFEEIVKNFIK